MLYRYMRPTSYPVLFYNDATLYFPENGERVQVYIGAIKYWNHNESLFEIDSVMQESEYVREGNFFNQIS